MKIFEGFTGGLIVATIAIIIAEIVFNYGLGDITKDFFLRIFGQVSSFAEARYNRAKALVARLEKAL